jgi:hypothetical protein
MTFEISFKDGDSNLSVVIGEDGVVLYKPTKSLTPALEVLAKSISEMASTKDEEELLLEHVRQAKDRVVLVGEDMCG